MATLWRVVFAALLEFAMLDRFIPNMTPCGRTRWEFLWEVGGGFAGLGLIGLLSRDGFFAAEAFRLV